MKNKLLKIREHIRDNGLVSLFIWVIIIWSVLLVVYSKQAEAIYIIN